MVNVWQATIFLSSGQKVHIVLSATDNIRDLQQRIEAITGIPTQHQKLMLRNQILPIHCKLERVESGSNISLHISGRGGADKCELCFSDAEFCCSDCNMCQLKCKPCCERFHMHPQRKVHQPQRLTNPSTQTLVPRTKDNVHTPSTQEIDEYEIPSSPESNSDAIFQEAMLLATLAERFGCTRFRSYQKDVIQEVLNGRDALVIQPTGSGKSLCFQFPAVHQQKKAVVIVPTISLMEDHFHNLQEKGIPSAYLGSAQTDKGLEDKVFQEDSQEKFILVTPEWLSKPERKARVRALAEKNALSLIAVDEAHLVIEWENFRPVYKEIQNLKYGFPTVPILLLTATAPPQSQTKLKGMLRNPVVSKASINRPNIELRVEKCPKSQQHPYQDFAKRVKEIVGKESGIIYTDFVNDVGPILCALRSLGFEAVGYYGEMDVRTKSESYAKWRSGTAQLMVATKAFGMGINRKDV